MLIIFLFVNQYYNANHTSLLTSVFVERVIDGDTFIDDKQKRYRFFGIDAPEMKDIPKGIIVKNVLSRLIDKKVVEVQKITIDIYKREVVKVFYQKIDIGLELIKRGYAKVAYISLHPQNQFFTNDFVYYRLLIETQYLAYKNGVGFWTNK